MTNQLPLCPTEVPWEPEYEETKEERTKRLLRHAEDIWETDHCLKPKH